MPSNSVNFEVGTFSPTHRQGHVAQHGRRLLSLRSLQLQCQPESVQVAARRSRHLLAAKIAGELERGRQGHDLALLLRFSNASTPKATQLDFRNISPPTRNLVPVCTPSPAKAAK
eukprot:3090076-Rhodomonas_salina.1